MKLSKLQESILSKPDDKVVVMASAASGKTAMMTEKVRQILRSGMDPTTIAVITFTNMAAEELRQRLGDDYKSGMFIGTIHALANYFLLSSGIDTSKYLNEDSFDELFSLVEDNPYCIRPINFLLLDEAQDSGSSEFKFIFDMINPPQFFVCGDIKQSIYGFKGAKPDLLVRLSHRKDVATYNLNQNYRNGYNILQYAKRLIAPTGMSDNSISLCREPGIVRELPYNAAELCTMVNTIDEYGSWAILTRTNAALSTIGAYLERKNIPFDTFKQGDLTKDELSQKLNQNTVKLLTIHSAKGLEWDNVCVVGTRFYPEEERNVCYVAATRARKRLVWMYTPKKKKVKTVNWE